MIDIWKSDENPDTPEPSSEPLTNKERHYAFLSAYSGDGSPRDVRKWLESHPEGRMCSFDYCRCKQ